MNVVVDFAHTPNAQEKVLSFLQKYKKSSAKLITVFGSAGERDSDKRPKMGKITSQLSDIVIITSEDPAKIAKEITEGIDYPFIIELNRKKAIRRALNMANPDDWVIVLGKGHETSMNFGGKEQEWSDIDIVTKLVEEVKQYKI